MAEAKHRTLQSKENIDSPSAPICNDKISNLFGPSDTDIFAQKSKKRGRKKKNEVDFVYSEDNWDMQECSKSKRRRDTKKKNSIRNIGSEDYSPDLVASQSLAMSSSVKPAAPVSSSSLLQISSFSHHDDFKKNGICLLNINGMVIPAILPLNNLHCGPSSQKSAFNKKATKDANSSLNSSSTTNNQDNTNNPRDKCVTTYGTEAQLPEQIIVQCDMKNASDTKRQAALQPSSFAGQDCQSLSKEQNKQDSSVKAMDVGLVSFNSNKLLAQNTKAVIRVAPPPLAPIQFQQERYRADGGVSKESCNKHVVSRDDIENEIKDDNSENNCYRGSPANVVNKSKEVNIQILSRDQGLRLNQNASEQKSQSSSKEPLEGTISSQGTQIFVLQSSAKIPNSMTDGSLPRGQKSTRNEVNSFLNDTSSSSSNSFKIYKDNATDITMNMDDAKVGYHNFDMQV